MLYTRSTLPDLNALAETQTRLGFPSTRIRTFCRLAPHVRLLAFIACERALPVVVFFPVTTHLRGIMISLLNYQKLRTASIRCSFGYRKLYKNFLDLRYLNNLSHNQIDCNSCVQTFQEKILDIGFVKGCYCIRQVWLSLFD